MNQTHDRSLAPRAAPAAMRLLAVAAIALGVWLTSLTSAQGAGAQTIVECVSALDPNCGSPTISPTQGPPPPAPSNPTLSPEAQGSLGGGPVLADRPTPMPLPEQTAVTTVPPTAVPKPPPTTPPPAPKPTITPPASRPTTPPPSPKNVTTVPTTAPTTVPTTTPTTVRAPIGDPRAVGTVGSGPGFGLLVLGALAVVVAAAAGGVVVVLALRGSSRRRETW